jgi:Beta-lactamase enzyme family
MEISLSHILTMRLALIISFLLLDQFVQAQAKSPSPDTKFLPALMRKHPGKFKSILDKRKTLEVQIVYTQINRDQNNRPTFKTFHYNVDTARYFYPASTVKFPMVLLALEKLNALQHPGVNKFTTIYHDSVYSGQRWSRVDTTAEGGVPSIAHYAKKIFVTSDNEAFNRLYEWVGQRETNNQLKQKGYHVRMLHRLDRRLTPDENRHTEAIRFAVGDSILYQQPMLVNDSIVVPKTITKGKGYYEDGALIRKPFPMSYRNYFHLIDQHDMLKAIIFPEEVPPVKRFNLTSEDRKFALQYMSQLPTETRFPPYYKDTVYTDAYSKFLLYGSDTTRIPDQIRIFNKIGLAYGFTIDNAYIVDFDAGVEFMLSAVIYTNKDEIFNDDKYEYKTIAFPFMKDLGQVIYEYEKARVKKYKPDLSGFKIEYDLKRGD